MWLLKLHFSISILCLLTFIGFREVFKEHLINNGYIPKKKKKLSGYLIFFVPILNIASVLLILIMIAMKKEELDRWCEEHKKNANPTSSK